MPRFPHGSVHARGLSDRVYSTLSARAAASGRTIHPLHVGDTYREPFVGARAESQRTADHPRLHNYAPVQGEPVLREAFAERLRVRHDARVAPDAIQVTSGATAGFAVAASVLLDVGDEVILPSPFWPLVRGIIASRGARPVQVPFHTRLGEPDFDVEATLESAVTERTVAIYVNSPNNPTGAVLDEAAIEAIARVAVRHDLWVLADEAYEELAFDAPPPAVWKHAALADRTLVFHTLSKSYGLAGSRIGFVHGPDAIMEPIRGMQTFLTYCAPRPLQIGAARALREADAWLEESRRLYRDAARATADAVGVPAPRAGTFLFFDAARFVPHDATTSAPLLERCADAGLLLTPGSVSGEHYARWARICFTAVPREQLDDALAVLRGVLGR